MCCCFFFFHPGPGAAAGRGGSSQTEASDGEGHHGREAEEARGGRHGAGRPEQQAQQGLIQRVSVAQRSLEKCRVNKTEPLYMGQQVIYFSCFLSNLRRRSSWRRGSRSSPPT